MFWIVLLLSCCAVTAQQEDEPRLVISARENDLKSFLVEMRTPSNDNPSHNSIDAQNQHGGTALQWAAFHGNLEMVDALISSGANVNLGNKLGYTPLMLSVMKKHEGVAIYLIRARADVNVKTLDVQSTALHYASWHGAYDVVETLIEYGADMMATDAHGHRAVSVASGSGHRKVRDFIARRSGESL